MATGSGLIASSHQSLSERFPEPERETILKALLALRDHLSLSGCAIAERAKILLPVSGAGIILRPPLIKPTVVVQPKFPQRFSRPRRKAMRAKTKLKPGQDGAKSLLDRYCGQLLCVRHRYDEARGLRHKTIELIAGTIPWSRQAAEIPSATIVGLKISLKEVELQTAVRQTGGKWNQNLQILGEIRQGTCARLHIRKRESFVNSICSHRHQLEISAIPYGQASALIGRRSPAAFQ